MNKSQAVEWMVENNLAKNDHNAGSIWEGLTLWKFGEDVQKQKVRLYREWRKYIMDTKLCFAYAVKGIEVPRYYKDV